MPRDPESPVQEGDIVAGKYRIERVLGVGGMGIVVAAMHLELEQRVALKFLRAEAAARPEEAARFSREARAAARIRSEHVARVIDVGRLPDGVPYIVMEYMDGDDLQRLLSRYGPMPFATAAGYILEACEAIAEAHALGIVHRDLKPANLFLAKGPSGAPIIKVLDFGISKEAPALGHDSLTKTSAIMGSPRYMSPEQLRSSKKVDARADIWALGAVLYELLVCTYPFDAETMTELVAAILEDQAAPIAFRRPDVPPGLDLVIARCLEKSPSRRFANVAELAHALAPYGPPRSEVSVERISRVLGLDPKTLVGALPAAGPLTASNVSLPPGPREAGMQPPPGMTQAQWSQSFLGTAPPRSDHRGLLVAGAIGLALAAVGIAVAVLGRNPAASHASAAPPAASSVPSAPSAVASTAPPQAPAMTVAPSVPTPASASSPVPTSAPLASTSPQPSASPGATGARPRSHAPKAKAPQDDIF